MQDDSSTHPKVAVAGTPPSSTRKWRVPLLTAVFLTLGIAFFDTGSAHAAWEQLSRILSLTGKPEPSSANVLSEHEIEGLDKMPPQSQAELLLKRSIKHFLRANKQIADHCA